MTKIFKGVLIIVYCLQAFIGFAQDNVEAAQDTSSYYEESDDYTDYSLEEETEPIIASNGLPYYTLHYDSAQVEIRAFDTTRLNMLKKDPELRYAYNKATMTLWDTFWVWLDHQLSDFFHEGEGSMSLDLVVILLVVAILTYMIIRLLKGGNLRMFYKAETTAKKNLYIIEDNIHEMDFEKLLEDAIKNKNYRVGIRLFFLYGLKMLADKEYIYWEPGKTNQEYVDELQSAELRNEFNQLNYYFEYAWYGNFAIPADLFARVNTIFTNWKKRI